MQIIKLKYFFLDPDLFFVPLGTLPWQPILGKICEMAFIQHSGISHRIQISQFRFPGNNRHNFCYILCNSGEDRSTNPKDLAGSFCTFWDETAKIDISYQISQQVLDRTLPTFQHWYRLMYADYKTVIIFAVVEEKLLW